MVRWMKMFCVCVCVCVCLCVCVSSKCARVCMHASYSHHLHRKAGHLSALTFFSSICLEDLCGGSNSRILGRELEGCNVLVVGERVVGLLPRPCAYTRPCACACPCPCPCAYTRACIFACPCPGFVPVQCVGLVLVLVLLLVLGLVLVRPPALSLALALVAVLEMRAESMLKRQKWVIRAGVLFNVVPSLVIKTSLKLAGP